MVTSPLGFSIGVSTMNVSALPDLVPVDTQANKRPKTLTEREENSCLIPFDLIIEILSRLPAKSIPRCRCVTKRWASLLRLPYFTDLFLTKSSTRPQLLFASEKDDHVFFFSSSSSKPQSSSLLTTSYYGMKVPDHCYSLDVKYSCIKGLALLRFKPVLNKHGHVSVICNPSTGQSLILPKVKTRRRIGVRSYLGYDPVEKQHKVLSMTWLYYGSHQLVSEEHQVLTLGGKKTSWRKIECSITYTSNYKYHHVCIDGVLYYPAQRSTGEFIIVCFDVRSEKFSFVKDTDSYTQAYQCAALKNYDGKLATLWPKTTSGSFRNIRLRVLEDVEKEEWSQHTYIFPDRWSNIVGEGFVRFVGFTRTKEIVFLSSHLQCLVYLDTERNTVVRVGIKGMEAVKNLRVSMFQDHVEDVKLMEVF